MYLQNSLDKFCFVFNHLKPRPANNLVIGKISFSCSLILKNFESQSIRSRCLHLTPLKIEKSSSGELAKVRSLQNLVVQALGANGQARDPEGFTIKWLWSNQPPRTPHRLLQSRERWEVPGPCLREQMSPANSKSSAEVQVIEQVEVRVQCQQQKEIF